MDEIDEMHYEYKAGYMFSSDKEFYEQNFKSQQSDPNKGFDGVSSNH